MNEPNGDRRQVANYCRSRTVEWGDSDPAGLINSPRAFDFAVETIESFYREVLGLSFLGLLQERKMGAPFVYASCDYRASLYEGQQVSLLLHIERLGSSSVTWGVDAVCGEKRVFEVRMISSFIDRSSHLAVPMPADFRQRMEPYVRAS